MSNPLRKKRANPVIWVLMGMLILGLGGFGARNFGGNVQSIGTVGDRDIDLRDYARSLNLEMNAFSSQIGQPVSFAQFQSLGLDRSILERVIATTALDNEVAKMGISVGDKEVRNRILEIQAFQGLDGKFDRDTYKFALQREGLSEAEFEGKLRGETARNLVQSAVLGATSAPQSFVTKLGEWVHETRDFTLAELIPADLTDPVPAPAETDLTAFYEAHPADFTRPELRQITYVWLSPEMVTSEVTLDETALRTAYDENILDYVTPERRMVEQLVFPTEAEASAAKARLDAGESDFAGITAERGLSLDDIDLGEVTQADLGAAGEAVFGLTEPGIVGPVATDLGPALISMNAILEAREVTFEEARDDLAAEATLDRARRLIAEKNEGIADILAGGASLEDVAKETGMTLGQIEFSETTADGIAAYTDFRTAAMAAKPDDFPTLAALDDGGVFALRLDRIDPPALRPLDDVRQEVVAQWTKAEIHDRLLAMGAEIQAQIDNGAALSATGLVTTRYVDFARGGFIEATPADVVARAFELDSGSAAIVDTGDRVFVVELNAINAADPNSAEVIATQDSIAQQLEQSLAQDMFDLYTQAVQAEAGISLDQAAINAVHAQLN